MPKHWYCVALLSLISAGPSFGQEQVTLKWRFEKDKPIFQEMTTETTSIMKVGGTEIKTVQKQSSRYRWTPIDEDAHGNWRIKQKLERMTLTQETTNSPPITYDSANEAATSPAVKIFKHLVGVEFTFTLDKELRVTKIEGRGEFLKKIRDSNEQAAALVKYMVSEDTLKEIAASSIVALPTRETMFRNGWERLGVNDMGAIGKFENTYRYVYKGKDRANPDLHRVEFSGSVKYVKPGPDAAAEFPFKVKEGELTAQKFVGYLLFDNRRGRVENLVMNLDITGSLTYEIGGQLVKLDLTQSTRTTSDFTGGADPLPDVIERPSPTPCVSYKPCPCRHHRLFWRLRRCR